MSELKISEELFTPASHVLETPEALLEVHDSEVKVERVLTAAEKAAKDEAARKEAERLAAEKQDNVRERGLNDMMNNRLESKSDDDIWIDLPKPEFMISVAQENWTDEQKKVAIEFKKKEDELADLRDKRRKALDAELRKLQEQIKTGCDSYDDRLRTLFHQKIDAEQAISVLEVSMLKLAIGVQEDDDSFAKENALGKEIAVFKQKKSSATVAVSAAKDVSDYPIGLFGVFLRYDYALLTTRIPYAEYRLTRRT